MSAVKAPRGLAVVGRALWKQVNAGMPAAFELDERERAVLALACRQADDVAALEVLLGRDGLVLTGSAGQPRLSALVTEVRQGRLAVARLLGQLEIPDADAQPRSESSRRAQHAAVTRWRQVETRKQARRGA